MKKVFFIKKTFLWGIIFLIAGVSLGADPLPDWFIPLRDAVYEQNLGAGEIWDLYREVKGKAEAALSGRLLYTTLSRCEYMMGRAYQYEERKNEAAARYEEGIAWAEKSLEAGPSPEGWQMLAENISQSCAVKPVSYAMANGLKVERYAKKALELDPSNGAALYMLAARYVYAPSPFNNFKRGIQMMEDILAKNDRGLQKDDLFNVYSAIGYAYFQQKKYGEAKPWFEKSLSVFPTNKFVGNMLKGDE
jgi:tetratricopeptide (TPR) repeat protein